MKIILIPFSYLFRIIVFFRNLMYSNGIFKTKELTPKIISVGNIAAGGTGKTPFVELIAKYLLEKGKFVIIILKGYKREHDDIKVVEVGFKNENNQLSTESLGDEAFLFLENIPNSYNGKGLIVVGDDKTKTAKFASTKFKPEIMIIDDGFQHRKLARDLDIVIITPDTDKHMLPAGNLREPLSNIRRANLVCVNTKFDKLAIAENTKSLPRITSHYEFEAFKSINGDIPGNGKIDAIAFCGIGEPESFKLLLEQSNVTINEFIVFPDHHNFLVGDVKKILHSYNRTGSKYILTTQKDYLRLRNSELVLQSKSDNLYKDLLFNNPLYYAKIKMQITHNAELLYDELDDLIRLT